MRRSEPYLIELWQTRVDAQFLYRGMSAMDLTDPLDPTYDPFACIRAELLQLIATLERLLDAGFNFTVHEDYSGCAFPLRDILAWTRGDLSHPGIDFTSSYVSACGYVQNYRGSQLKQNFRYITGHLPEDDPLIRRHMGEAEWRLVKTVNRWMSTESAAHRPVVIHARRSCHVFEAEGTTCLLCGSFPFFRQQVLARLAADGLPCTPAAIAQIVPLANAHFDLRLTNPLPLSCIEKVEEIT